MQDRETTKPSKNCDCEIAWFRQYQDKEFVRSFYKNLKGIDISISDDFLREVEDSHKTLCPVLKRARRNQQQAYFKVFDKLIMEEFTEEKKPKNFVSMEI